MENPSLQIGDNNWAVKDGSILGYNIIQDNYLPQPITFTRASTATRVNSSGLIESVATGVPRIDYTTGSPSLLLEPQRTNIITYSEQIDNAAWNKTNVTITANAITSPIASFNADAIVENSASNVVFGVHRASRPSGLTPGTTYSVSFFAKKVTRDFCYYNDFNGFQAPYVNVFFNLASGIVGTATTGVLNPKMENYGNGWYRCSFQFVASGGAGVSIDYRIGSATTDNTLTYTGVIGQQAISLTACQFETGSYPTSYIPTTSGVAVTRVADRSNTNGLSTIINSVEGTIIFKGSAASIAERGGISIGKDLLSSERISFYYRNDNIITVKAVTGGGIISALDYSYASINHIDEHCFGIVYSASGMKLFRDGALVKSNVNSASFTVNTLNSFDLFSDNVAYPLYGKLQQALIFQTALSDAELIALTTI